MPDVARASLQSWRDSRDFHVFGRSPPVRTTVNPPINFRDFGGHHSRFGGSVRTDRLYRSGHFASSSGEMVQRLLALDFALVADLRYSSEQKLEPSPWPPGFSGRVLVHSEKRSEAAPHLALVRRADCRAADIRQYYRQLYRELPFCPVYRPLFAGVIGRMAEVEGRVLIHCTAGKDRTGVLVALVLDALGADRQAIVDDYLRSRGDPGLTALGGPIRSRISPDLGFARVEEIISALLAPEKDYLAEMFRSIEENCGSVEAYLQEGGITGKVLGRLREHYVEG